MRAEVGHGARCPPPRGRSARCVAGPARRADDARKRARKCVGSPSSPAVDQLARQAHRRQEAQVEPAHVDDPARSASSHRRSRLAGASCRAASRTSTCLRVADRRERRLEVQVVGARVVEDRHAVVGDLLAPVGHRAPPAVALAERLQRGAVAAADRDEPRRRRRLEHRSACSARECAAPMKPWPSSAKPISSRRTAPRVLDRRAGRGGPARQQGQPQRGHGVVPRRRRRAARPPRPRRSAPARPRTPPVTLRVIRRQPRAGDARRGAARPSRARVPTPRRRRREPTSSPEHSKP